MTASGKITDFYVSPSRGGRLFTSADTLELLDRPGSLWNSPACCTGQRDPFCCTSTWQLSFHDAFSPKRRLLVRTSSDSLVAFAEKVFSPGNIYLTPIESHWFFGSNVLGPNGLDLLVDTLVDIERFYTPRFPLIVLGAIAPRSTIFKSFKSRLAGRFDFHKHASGIQCAASLDGGLDGYLSRRSANHRKKLKKQFRLAKNREVTFERHSPPLGPDIDEVYDRMLAVERASWKGLHHSGMTEQPSKRFYAVMLARLAASRSSRIIFAKHENKDIGFIFGGMAGKIYRGQQFSYDEDWRESSIGNLLQLEQVRWLCEEGAERYDMGPLSGDGMGYKRHWTEKRLHIETWVLERK